MANNRGEFWGDVVEGLGNAITDIREKVVEEPWWGRSLGDAHEQAMPNWSEVEQAQAAQSVEQQPEVKTPEHDIDR